MSESLVTSLMSFASVLYLARLDVFLWVEEPIEWVSRVASYFYMDGRADWLGISLYPPPLWHVIAAYKSNSKIPSDSSSSTSVSSGGSSS